MDEKDEKELGKGTEEKTIEDKPLEDKIESNGNEQESVPLENTEVKKSWKQIMGWFVATFIVSLVFVVGGLLSFTTLVFAVICLPMMEQLIWGAIFLAVLTLFVLYFVKVVPKGLKSRMMLYSFLDIVVIVALLIVKMM